MNNQEKTNYQNKLKQMTMEFNLPKDQSSIIKVIGVGGGGGNAVNHMFEQGIRGVNYIICNTDQQALDLSPVVNKIQLGPEITQGLGAGSLPSVGEQATMESEQDIKDILENNTKMCFVTAGMGGGTGTGGAPIIAQIARDMGILTVGIVTTPFSFEGRRKLIQADEGIKKLKESVDALIVVSNDKIREMFGNLSNRDAFSKADEVLLNAAKSISEIITVPGQINVDFADVQYVMKNSGIAIMGTGEAEGEERSLRSVQMALNSPLLDDNNITGAKNILINISSGLAQVTIDEITEISNYVQDAAGNETDIIFGTCDDDSLGDKLNITIIATGFEKKITEQVVVKKEVISLDNVAPKSEQKPVVNLEDETSSNTIDFDVDQTIKQDDLEGMTLKEKEIPAEEPKLSFYTSDSKPLVEQKRPSQEDQKAQEYVNHKQRLKDLSYKWDAKQKDMEDIPAYKRRGVDLNDVENSSANNNSKYTLDSFDLENGDKKPEIRKNNKFLDDNVD
ncbi:MAG: cell division protein FtsZ [Chitinophagales bacterium]